MNFNTVKDTLKNKGYDLSGVYVPYAMDIRDYMSRHDVVYHTPMKNGFDGLPVGNGNIGVMVWNSDEAISLQINKNDLWIYPDEEDCRLLRAAGQLKLDFGMPIFNQLYLDNYEARLALADETAVFSSATAFGKIEAKFSVDSEKNNLIIDVTGEIAGSTTLRLSMERYGSRGYRGWSSDVRDGSHNGLGLAKAEAKDGRISVFEPFDESGKVSCAMVGAGVGDGFSVSRISSRRAEVSAEVEGTFSRTFVVSVASTSESDDPSAYAAATLDEAISDICAIRRRTAEWWRDFWNRSFVHFSKKGEADDFDYLENLYYIQNYVMGVSSRGTFPAPFNGALCVWNHDIRQWVVPHHWNTQQAYWSIEEGNHPELMKPYLDTYYRMIPAASEHVKSVFESDNGLAISEGHEFDGRMVLYHNTTTPAMQVAIHFWNHYLYNKDEDYLRNVAYPFISRCANLYADIAEFDESTGKYNIGPVMPAESAAYNNLYNTVLDASMTRYILPAAIKAAEILGIDGEEVDKWRDLLDNMFDFIYIRDYSPECALGDMLATGLMPDMKTTIGVSHGFCRAETPVMPAGIIGLRDKGSRLFESVKYSTGRIMASALAITPQSGLWARMGEGEKAVSSLFDAIDSLQHFSQGLFYNLDGYHSHSRVVKKDKLGFKYNELALPFYQRDYLYDERVVFENVRIRDENGEVIRTSDVPTQAFSQCGLETPGILAHAFQELAMQSYEGVIRIFPSFGEGYDGVFTLKAMGGFMVTGAIDDGNILPYSIVKSLLGGKCVIDAPFEKLVICDDDGNEVSYTVDREGFVTFETEAGKTYILYSESITEEEIASVQFDKVVNNGRKSFRTAVIGSNQCY